MEPPPFFCNSSRKCEGGLTKLAIFRQFAVLANNRKQRLCLWPGNLKAALFSEQDLINRDSHFRQKLQNGALPLRRTSIVAEATPKWPPARRSLAHPNTSSGHPPNADAPEFFDAQKAAIAPSVEA